MKKRYLLIFLCGAWLLSCHPAYAAEFPKQGLSFDGIDDLVDVPSITSDFTAEGGVEMVLKNPAPGNSYYLLGGNIHTRTYLVIRGNGTVQMTKGEPKVELTSTKVITDGKKHTISLFWKNSIAWFYVDGELEGSTSFVYTVLNGTIMKLGRHTVTEGQYAKMDLLEFRRWNRVISETMIQQNVNQSLTGNETGLTSLYRFTPYTTGVIYDQTAQHYNATATGFSTNLLQPRVTSQHLDHLTFAWSSVPEATYRVKRNGVVVYTGSADQWTDDNVVKETSYTYAFQAITPEGESKEETLVATAEPPYWLTFNGLDDMVRVNGASHLEPSKVTMEMWIRPSEWNNAIKTLISKRNGIYTGYMMFYNNDTHTIQIDWGGFNQRWNTGYTPPANHWTHLAYTYDGSVGRFYVNGSLFNSTTKGDSSVISSLSYFSIGRDAHMNNYYYKGDMSEVRVWNVARTQAEIQSTMYISLSGIEPKLVAYYPLDAVSNKTVIDKSSYKLNGITYRFSISHLRTTVGIQSGQLTISSVPTSSNKTISLTGNIQEITFPLSPIVVSDGRGSGAGWNLNVVATPFQEIGGQGYVLPSQSFVLATPTAMRALHTGMRTILPALTTVEAVTLDNGQSITLAVANVNEGMGTYELSFPSFPLKLSLLPADTKTDPFTYGGSPTPYMSTITWTLSTGP